MVVQDKADERRIRTSPPYKVRPVQLVHAKVADDPDGYGKDASNGRLILKEGGSLIVRE